MKRITTVLLISLSVLLILLIFKADTKANQTAQTEYEAQEYVPYEVLVRLKEDVIGDFRENKWLIRNVINSVQGKIKTYLKQEKNTYDWEPNIFTHRSFIGDPYLLHLKIPEYMGVEQAISILKSIPYVEYAEKNGILRLQTQTFPDDDDFSEQWGLFNSPNRADIHAPEAWSIFTGSSDVVVAVLDSGIDFEHDDLENRLWTNPNDDTADEEDNDNNGFEDDTHGWDFVGGDNDPSYVTSHGTHVSGLIGAEGNNAIGISGICWNVRIMPIRVSNNDDTTNDALLTNGLDYATRNGAFLSNISIGGTGTSYVLQGAIGRALQKSKLVIAAAGNNQQNNDTANQPIYPASYSAANIISVLSTTENDTLSTISNWGPQSVDIGAPGGDVDPHAQIYSTTPGNNYGVKYGTSMAAPLVSGVAALALGICPGLTYSQLKSLILNGVDEISSLNNKCVSEGRLNAYNVLNALGGSTSPGAPSGLSAQPTAWNIILLHWSDNSNNELGFEIQRKDQYQSVFIHDNCSASNSTSTVSFQDKSIDPTDERTYTYRVRATNAAGVSSFTDTASASVPATLPSAPSDLEAPAAVYPTVHLAWCDNATNEFQFSLERRISGYGNWSVIASPGANNTSHMDSNVQVGITYDYRIRATNPVGNSSYSNVVTVEVVDW
jgi:subtilisin family serine protease